MGTLLTPTELEAMESRFRRIERDSAVRSYRRAKLETKAAPGQHPDSKRAQLLVKQVNSDTAKARQRALDAMTKSPTEALASSIRDAANRLPADNAGGNGKADRYLIFGIGGSEPALMVINEISGDTIYASAVNGSDGSKVLGAVMVPISVTKMKSSFLLFATLPDALAYAKADGIKLLSN